MYGFDLDTQIITSLDELRQVFLCLSQSYQGFKSNIGKSKMLPILSRKERTPICYRKFPFKNKRNPSATQKNFFIISPSLKFLCLLHHHHVNNYSMNDHLSTSLQPLHKPSNVPNHIHVVQFVHQLIA